MKLECIIQSDKENLNYNTLQNCYGVIKYSVLNNSKYVIIIMRKSIINIADLL